MNKTYYDRLLEDVISLQRKYKGLDLPLDKQECIYKEMMVFFLGYHDKITSEAPESDLSVFSSEPILRPMVEGKKDLEAKLESLTSTLTDEELKIFIEGLKKYVS